MRPMPIEPSAIVTLLLIVPALMYFMGMSQMAAQGTSLALMLPPIGALAVMNYWRAEEVDLRAAGIMVVAFVIGGYFGSRLALSLNPMKVRLAFGVIMLYVAVRMIWGAGKALWVQ